VVSKMLEQAGFRVALQLLDGAAFNRKTHLDNLDQPPGHQPWDIALTVVRDAMNFPVFQVYRAFALDGPLNWGIEDGTLHQLHDAVLQTIDREQQQALIRQMERHTHAQAYVLFLYNPIQLYAVNKAVAFTPYVTILNLAETGVTEQHSSVRKQKADTQE
jgi:ABC-type transport system substrate-binding protein